MESRLIPKMGIKYYGISAGKFRRYHKSRILNILDPTTFIANFTDLFRFIKGIVEARDVLEHEKPDVVFAKGGYVSLPVGFAARLLKIPVVIHESDIIMGISNKRMSKFAKKVCVTFPTKNFPDVKKEKLIETGNPIRQDILNGRGERYLSEIGFDKSRKTILILGGSQGSLLINEIILETLHEILSRYQIIWVTGDRDAAMIEYKISELDEKLKKYVKVYGFVTSEIADIYSVTDLFIGRAGSNVIFELAAHGIPAVFIPLGSSAGSHQYENARALSRTGAAYIFNEETLNGKRLMHQINYLFDNEKELLSLSEKMKGWANIGAADNVAKTILETGEGSIESTETNKK